MSSRLPPAVKARIPQELRDYVRRRRAPAHFDDSFCDWDSASAAASGYDSDEIVQRVLTAVLAVRQGEAALERDSVTFDRHEYVWPVMTGLMWAAASTGGLLNVVDFGGSLGSTYFQSRSLLERLGQVRWNIVEQPAFAEAGRRNLETAELRFFDDLERCLETESPNVIHFGSSLQYVADPWSVLASATASSAHFLIVDRTPVSNLSHDLPCVQHVPASIYPASYACWVFGSERLERELLGGWQIVASFDSLGGTAKTVHGVPVSWQGWLCTR